MKEGIFISQLHLRAWLLDESFQVNVDEHASSQRSMPLLDRACPSLFVCVAVCFVSVSVATICLCLFETVSVCDTTMCVDYDRNFSKAVFERV